MVSMFLCSLNCPSIMCSCSFSDVFSLSSSSISSLSTSKNAYTSSMSNPLNFTGNCFCWISSGVILIIMASFSSLLQCPLINNILLAIISQIYLKSHHI
ncbi:secreted protein [Candidatus Magnetobacterium bavaricum]|uniref:Secreted protein n=1 Tax=Candidatus Magnetobacterium bavaricum TaxID=29290 RepID=A0A0F3GTX3_9BACT|nr:secreted protein [Candidatus Magnetobacterium bavaricum]